MATLREVLREWGRMGVVGFGGPPAHVALLRDLCVERRRWLTAREFEDANAACGLLPGPASTQLAIYCAGRVGGPAGAIVGGLAFILPGLVMLIALAAVTIQAAPPTWARGLAAGAGAAAIAVVAQAGWSLARAAVLGQSGPQAVRAAAYLLAGVVATIATGPWVVLVLLGCGVLELALRRALPQLPLALAGAAQLPAIAWTALKVGALSYGGGLVIVPLMEGDAVDAHGWMTRGEFLNAVALGQLTPGPVVQTVAAVGWAADGLPGAVVASVFAFAPSFVLVMTLSRRFEQLRESRDARAFLDGAGPAAVGAILGAAVGLADGLGAWWQWVLAGVAAAALFGGRAGVVPVLGAAALTGIVAGVLGAPLP